MHVLAAIDPAIAHTKRVLFAPFDIAKWLSLGVIIFLDVLLAGGSKANFNFRFPLGDSSSGGFTDLDPGEWIRNAEEWAFRHAGIVLAIGLAVFLLWVGLQVLFTWLGSRGQIMFIRAVALNDERIGENWRQTRTVAWSLFVFRFVLTLAGLLLSLVLLVGACLAVRQPALAYAEGIRPYVLPLIPFVIVGVLFGLLFTLINVFLRNLVAPLMFHFNLSCMDGWRALKRIVPGNVGALFGFLALKLVYSLAFGIAAGIVTLCTCCVGAIPVIHHALFSPFYVFDRSFSLLVLESLGPDYQIITQELPVEEGAPPPIASR